VVITSGGIVHDTRANGTEEGAVHDVAGADKATPITVIATFEDGVHVLCPVGGARSLATTLASSSVWGRFRNTPHRYGRGCTGLGSDEARK
jgi:hypothetical protein